MQKSSASISTDILSGSLKGSGNCSLHGHAQKGSGNCSFAILPSPQLGRCNEGGCTVLDDPSPAPSSLPASSPGSCLQASLESGRTICSLAVSILSPSVLYCTAFPSGDVLAQAPSSVVHQLPCCSCCKMCRQLPSC